MSLAKVGGAPYLALPGASSLENMFKLKSNFSKREVVVLGVNQWEQGMIAYLINCKLGPFPSLT
jgi:hypothetical protein